MKRIIRTVLVMALLAPAGAGAREVLTLEDAWQLVLAWHPAQAAVEADIAARQADLEQAGKGLNPELEFEAENFAGSGDYSSFDAAELTLMLSQTWELGSKADGRRQVAAAAIEASLTAAEVVRLRLHNDLVRFFVEVLAAQRRVDLADTLAQVLIEDLAAVERRVTAGADNRISAQRAQLAASGARRARTKAREELTAARMVLGSLWGDNQAAFATVTGDLDSLVAVPAWEDVLAQVPTSPLMRLAAAELARGRAGVEVARSLGAMNLTTAAGVRHFRGVGDNAVVVAVGVPLLVRNTNRDAQRAAAADVDRLAADLRATAVDIKSELTGAWSRLAISHADVLALRNDMLPTVEATMREALRTYQRGVFSLTDVLAVRRSWTEWQLRHVDALARHHLAVAELAALLGSRPAPEVRP